MMSDLRRDLTHRRLAHYGWPATQIDAAEHQCALMATTRGHESLGCEWEGYGWGCSTESDMGISNHSLADELGEAAEWVVWVLDELSAMGIEVAADV